MAESLPFSPSPTSSNYESSRNFGDKHRLPLVSRFRLGDKESFVFDRLEVRRAHGPFWGRWKRRQCVLLLCGKLLIYGGDSFDSGLVIPLSDLQGGIRVDLSNKELVGEEPQTRCIFTLSHGGQRLALRVTGKQKVALWRKGVVLSSQGADLSTHARETAEGELWTQPRVSVEHSDQLFSALSALRARSHASMPHLGASRTRLPDLSTRDVRSLDRRANATLTVMEEGGGETGWPLLLLSVALPSEEGLKEGADSGVHSPELIEVEEKKEAKEEEVTFAIAADTDSEIETTVEEEKKKGEEEEEEEEKQSTGKDWRSHCIGTEMPRFSIDLLDMDTVVTTEFEGAESEGAEPQISERDSFC